MTNIPGDKSKINSPTSQRNKDGGGDDLPPQSREAEMCLLGSMLRDNSIIPDMMRIVGAEHFYLDAHQKIFLAIIDLGEQGSAIDAVLLAEELKARKQVEDIGGYSYLGKLWDAAPTAANAESYAGIVLEKWQRRQLILTASGLAQDARDGCPIDELTKRLSKLDQGMSGGRGRREVEIFTAAELIQTELPQAKQVVRELIPEGFNICAGKPKLGKSWLVLDISLAVSFGGSALGRFSVSAGDVLYLALEDTKGRLKKRLETNLKKQLGTVPDRLHLARQWPRLDQGGYEELVEWIKAHPDARLIVIDTWAKFRPSRIRGSDTYEEDYAHASLIKKLADDHAVGIVAVHHCRKMGAQDPLDEVNGTLGITAAADGILVLRRERGKADASLFVTGRDIDEKELALRWDSRYASWSILGEADEYRLSQERGEVIDLFRKEGRSMTPSEVAPLLDKKVSTTKSLLWRLSKDDWLKADGSGKYFLPPPGTNGNN